MNRWAIGLSAAIAAAASMCAGTAFASKSGGVALARFSAAWDQVNTYACTITAREVSGSRVQDRVYQMWFRKPHMSRMDITGGDGRGSAVVWDGGDKVYGHQGGFLAMFKKHLDLHDRLATTVRGTTVAEASFGALLDHIKGLKGATVDAVADTDKTRITISVTDPSADNNVTKELMVLGSNNLPVEYDQWEGDAQVKHITYSEVKLNVDIPDSVFTL
jgi:outer membrane lipoprotein-sorting protein